MTPSERIDRYIAETAGWRGETLAHLRRAILAADPEIVEEWKWMGSPTWSRDGLIAVGNAHKAKVKLTFAHGARLPDPAGLFNGNDTGATRRSIDLFEGDGIDEAALSALVLAAIDHNRAHLKKNAALRAKAASAKSP
ncbi:hypothetical protein DFR52_102726 [Hoeflea marina]|uniref:YdhG-like domain-containing protein n=1 Tax=Hoeflea marina TaxID=274592 RepID=A0A317PR70_9HYPH|nr:DUF1801 domain-containing protein [Hoeflea marina]PWW02060.1 hypothetical protein DFR52_102726 [Hoeflea marina]